MNLSKEEYNTTEKWKGILSRQKNKEKKSVMNKKETLIYVTSTYLLKIENHRNKWTILHEGGIENHKT